MPIALEETVQSGLNGSDKNIISSAYSHYNENYDVQTNIHNGTISRLMDFAEQYLDVKEIGNSNIYYGIISVFTSGGVSIGIWFAPIPTPIKAAIISVAVFVGALIAIKNLTKAHAIKTNKQYTNIAKAVDKRLKQGVELANSASESELVQKLGHLRTWAEAADVSDQAFLKRFGIGATSTVYGTTGNLMGFAADTSEKVQRATNSMRTSNAPAAQEGIHNLNTIASIAGQGVSS